MKRAFAMVVALAGASALAAVEFSPLNVSSVELATGVTHPEFRDATNALWQAKLDKRIVHYRMPEGGASREFAETAEELREVMRRVGDPAFCQVDGAYMLTMTSAAVSPSGQEFMGNFRGPMDLTKDYVLAVSVTNSPAGVAYVSSVTFGTVERVVASTSEYNTTAKIMTRVEQKANASALNSYLLLNGSSHMTGSLKTSYGYDNVVQDNTSYPLTFMKKDTTAFTSNPFKFRQLARVTGDERFSYLTPDGTPVATSNMVEGIAGSVKDYANETFLPKIGSDDANITLKSLTMTSDESKIEFGGFDSEILIGDSPLKMGSNNATSMQAYGLFDEETGTVRPFVCFDNAWKVRFLSDDGATFSDFYPDGSVVLTSNMVESIVPSFISHTLPHFSNEVLAVGLNVDTNVVAALNAISGLPIDPTTGATTIAGIIAALAAAVAWLKKNKLTKGITNGVPDDPNVSQLFTSADTSTDPQPSGALYNAILDKGIVKVSNALIADACPYGVNVLSAQDLQLVDGCVNTINLNAADVHLVLPMMPIGKQADLLIEITVAAGATVSGFSIVAPTGSTMERIRMTDDVTIEAPASGTTIYQFMYTSRRMDNGTGTPAYRVYSAQKKGEVVA